MENWGLVTYRESLLLVSADTPPPQVLSVARVIGHEVAHMWFGDMVTMVLIYMHEYMMFLHLYKIRYLSTIQHRTC